MKTNSIARHILILIAIMSAISNQAATITWTNISGGDWSAGGNWNPNQPPGQFDDAVITASGTYTITQDISAVVNSLTLGGTSGQQTLNIGANSFSVKTPSTANTNSVLDISGSGKLGGALTMAGVLNWNGGTLLSGSFLTVTTNSVLNISSNMVINGAVTNSGTVNWQAGMVTVDYNPGIDGSTGVILNKAGGVWNIQCDQSLFNTSGQEQFNNAGLLEKTAGTGTNTVGIFLANSGTVTAQSGTIQETVGSDLGGTFQAASGAAIYFSGSSYVLSVAPNFQGPGQVGFNNGNFIINGLLIGTMNWYGGVYLSGSSLTVSTNGILNIAGTVAVQGGLTNASTVNWQSGTVTVQNSTAFGYSGVIWNLTNGVWNIQCDQNLNNSFGAEVFNNAGVIQKTAGTNTNTFGIFLANSGTTKSQSGTLQFTVGSDLKGIFQASNGAALYFSSGNYNLTGALNLQGPGQIGFNNGSFTINGALLGNLNWYGGTLASGSSLVVNSNSTLNILGSVVTQSVLTNSGTINWQDGAVRVDNTSAFGYTGAIWNGPGGVWNIQCDQTLNNSSGSEQFNNAGIIQKNGGTNTNTFNIFLANSGATKSQSGTLQFAVGSDLKGTFQASNSAALFFTGGTYNLTGALNFQGPGQIGFNTGSFTINGSMIGDVNWYGGTLLKDSLLTVATNSVLNILGSVTVQSILTNNGTANWLAGNVTLNNDSTVGNQGQIWNEGIWNAECDQTLANTSGFEVFFNDGLFQKFGTTGTTVFDVYLGNTGNILAGTGTIYFPDGAHGRTFYQGVGGLSVALGGTNANLCGHFQADTAQLIGSFTAILTNGFVPATGNTFQALSYSSRSGTFSAVTLPSGVSLNYSNNGVFLVVTGTAPIQITSPAFSSGNFSLSFSTILNQSYTLQQNTNLLTTNWITATNFLGSGSNFQYSAPAAGPQNFYRVTSP